MLLKKVIAHYENNIKYEMRELLCMKLLSWREYHALVKAQGSFNDEMREL